MEVLSVTGGRPLYGEVRIHGAKNAVLPILAACVITGGICELRNCPDILDVQTALQILRHLGCLTYQDGSTIVVDSAPRARTDIPACLAEKMRSSVIFLGALLTAAGEAQLHPPGGCALGKRPIDLHLSGLEQLGAKIHMDDERITCRAKSLHGGTVILPYPSVGATENLMLAALGAKAPVRIVGTAKEPEIVDLADFLRLCGAKIYGAGTSTVAIEPSKLHPARCAVIPDRMEAATYLAATACAGGSVTLRQANAAHLQAVLPYYRAAGCVVREYRDAIHIEAQTLRAVAPITTGPYPAFATDAQATLMAAMLKAEGTTVFEETVFENRYRHVEQLCKLGADIRVAGRIASVRGVRRLHGADMEATDLRGGAAMLAAALGAQGQSSISRIYHIDRGYENMTEIMQLLGAQVRRIHIQDAF